MGIRARIAGFAAAGLLVVAPVLVGQQAAGAAVNSSSNSNDFSFADNQDLVQDCTIIVQAQHDSTAHTLSAQSGLGGNAECFSGFVTITVDYHDARGTALRAESDSTATGSLTLDGVYSNVKVTVKVTFDSCNPHTNATCTGSVATAPK